MEGKKIDNAAHISFEDNNIRFDEKSGHLIINKEVYKVEYFPAGSKKALVLNAKQREQITKLAMKILQQQKAKITAPQLEGLTITDKGIQTSEGTKVSKFDKNSKAQVNFSDIRKVVASVLKTDKERSENDDPLNEITLRKVPDQEEQPFDKDEEEVYENDDTDFNRAIQLSLQMGNNPKGTKFDDSSLKQKGFFEHEEIKGDGSCFFSAIGEHLSSLNDSKDKQKEVRQDLSKQLLENQSRYQKIIDRSPKEYADALVNPSNERWDQMDPNSVKGWGGPVELKLAADFYERPVVFITANCTEIDFDEHGLPVYNDEKYSENQLCVIGQKYRGQPPIYLYYNGSDHYDALFLKPRQN